MDSKSGGYNRQADSRTASASVSTISNDNNEPNFNSIESKNVNALKKRKVNKKGKSKKSRSSEPSIFTDMCGLVRKLWATRQTETIDKEKDPDLYVKITIRELIIYAVFLAILCIITFGMTSSTVFHFTSILQNQFTAGETSEEPAITFNDVATMEDVWRYLKGPLLDALYTEWYIESNSTEDTSSYVLNENRLLGVPRLRQLKVKNNSCVVHDDFKEEIKFCYDSYSEFTEDQEPFGNYYTFNDTNNTAWFYQSEKQLKGSSVQALVNKYGGGGFVKTLSKDRTETENIIDELLTGLWITRGTRVIFIDLTLYNANLNLFCQIRLTFEFPATGGVVPSSLFRTTKLLRYVTPMDYFVLCCEAIFVLFIIYYTIEEIIEIYTQGTPYFHRIWNVLDVVIILMSYVCIAFNIFRQFKVAEILDSLLQDEQQFQDFEFLCYWQMQFNCAVAGAVFLSWMKIFKYTSFNKTMTQLTETLGRCAKDVTGFAVMFFIIFFAYAQLGYLVFGTQVHDFSTFHYAVYTLFRIILGDFDYESIEKAQRVLGPIYFLTYVFFVFFVLLNMFLAIINDTYSEVKAEIVNSEIELTNFIKRGYNKVLEKYNLKRDRIIDIQQALARADLNKDYQIDFDEWRNDLRAKGYADAEIETLFAKYDLDGDRVLNQQEQRKMYEDMAEQNEELKEALKEFETANPNIDEENEEKKKVKREGVPFEDYSLLSGRIDKMETSLDGIVAKIDSVLMKLDLLEKAKKNREMGSNKDNYDNMDDNDRNSANSRTSNRGIALGQGKNTQSFC